MIETPRVDDSLIEMALLVVNFGDIDGNMSLTTALTIALLQTGMTFKQAHELVDKDQTCRERLYNAWMEQNPEYRGT